MFVTSVRDEHGQPPERVDCEKLYAIRVSGAGGQARLGTRFWRKTRNQVDNPAASSC